MASLQKAAERALTRMILYLPVGLYRLRRASGKIALGAILTLSALTGLKMIVRLRTAHALRRRRAAWREKQQTTFRAMREALSAQVGEAAYAEVGGLSAISLQEQLQAGKLSPLLVLRCFMKKALGANETHNFIAEPIKEAEEWATSLEKRERKGLLHGIPISVKEHIAIKGYDRHSGKTRLLGEQASDDSVVVKVVKQQGGIPFIQTNLPQLSHAYECTNPIVGTTTNPLSPGRTPGGSSGGESAALAAGASVLGLGSDLGGSLRVPAAFCGVCALKPTDRRISSSAPSNRVATKDIVRSVWGPMARDVDGLLLLSRALLSPLMFTLDKSVLPVPFREEMFASSAPLTVGYYVDNGVFPPVPAVRRAVLEAVDILSSRGHQVVEISVDGEKMVEAIANIYCPARSGNRLQEEWEDLRYDEISPSVEDMYRKTTYPKWLTNIQAALLRNKDPYESKMWQAWHGVPKTTDWWRLRSEYGNYRSEHLRQWSEFGVDVVICPVVGFVAPPLGTAQHLDHPAFTYSRLYNLVDFPSGVLPVTKVTAEDLQAMDDYPSHGAAADAHKVMSGSEGLPVGVQVVSLPFQEELCLRVMALLEGAVQGN